MGTGFLPYIDVFIASAVCTYLPRVDVVTWMPIILQTNKQTNKLSSKQEKPKTTTNFISGNFPLFTKAIDCLETINELLPKFSCRG